MNVKDLPVILAVFICVPTLATVLSLPAFEWATGGPDWKIMLALVWTVACYVLCAWAAMRFFNAYRH